MKRRLKRIGTVLAVVLALLVVGTFGATWVIQVPFSLLTGFIPFLIRVIPAVTVSPWSLALAGMLAAVVVWGAHHVARSFYDRSAVADMPGRIWKVRWSLFAVAGLLLVFAATIATAGIIHQAGWIATSPEPLVQSSWDTPSFNLRRLCDYVNRVKGRPFRETSAEMWGDSRFPNAAEHYRIILVESPDGGFADVIAFPRDNAPTVSRKALTCNHGDYPEFAIQRLLQGAATGHIPDLEEATLDGGQ